MTAVVAGLAITPVKGTRLQPVDRVVLERLGVRGNRRFYLIDDRARMVNAKNLGALQTVLSEYSEAQRRLRLTFPDGRAVDGEIALGEPVRTRFYSRSAAAREVVGPWSQALSDHVGQPLRLVEADDEGAVDRGAGGAVTLISKASLARLASEAATNDIDGRRFRMLIEIEGPGAHEEDGWVGRSVRIGDATVTVSGHVGRCLITSRHPDTGKVDLPTLDVLRSYRGQLAATEPLPFGVYGAISQPGAVAVGDGVAVVG